MSTSREGTNTARDLFSKILGTMFFGFAALSLWSFIADDFTFFYFIKNSGDAGVVLNALKIVFLLSWFICTLVSVIVIPLFLIRTLYKFILAILPSKEKREEKLRMRVQEMGLASADVSYVTMLQKLMDPAQDWENESYRNYATNHFLNLVEKQAIFMAKHETVHESWEIRHNMALKLAIKAFEDRAVETGGHSAYEHIERYKSYLRR